MESCPRKRMLLNMFSYLEVCFFVCQHSRMSFPFDKHSGDGLDEFDVSQIVTEYPFNMPWHLRSICLFFYTHTQKCKFNVCE